MPRTTLTKVRAEQSTCESYDPDGSFYASRQWRTFRAKHKQQQVANDVQVATALHKSNKNISGLDLAEFIASGEPLCQEALKQNKITIAGVLDHINPIRQGGQVWDYKNLQWLSHEAHNRKRAQESHQSRRP